MKRVVTVQEILRRWDPIGIKPGEEGVPAGEYDSYAHHIVSMVAGGCSLDDLCKHLGSIRADVIGIAADPTWDREIAAEILEALRNEA